jgi:acetate kinase
MAMETYSLIVNLGSASKKYALYTTKGCVAFFHIEKRALDYISNETFSSEVGSVPLSATDYERSLPYILLALHNKLTVSKEQISNVAIRVVAPGTYFTQSQLVTEAYVEKLKSKAELDPLHITPTLTTLQELQKELPQSRLVAISDSEFHNSIDRNTRPLPFAKTDCETYDLRPFGYHGISLQSIVPKIETLLGSVPTTTIVCHLCGGSSVTALHNGKSVATSMSYSPLGGVVMSTRSGNVDPGALLALMQEKKLSPNDTLTYLYKESGLKGISGSSGDIPQLLELEERGEKNAHTAITNFTMSIAEEISRLTISLGKLEALIFSGTIGERSSIIRERIVTHLSCFNIKLEKSKNARALHEDSIISSPHSSTIVATIHTDEMGTMAKFLRSFSS